MSGQNLDIPLSSIRLRDAYQPRVRIDTEVVAEYLEAIRHNNGRWPFPPLTIVAIPEDGDTGYYLVDGWHRFMAATDYGLATVPCAVHVGTVRMAMLVACKANSTHGLRRTSEDKRAAVARLLADPRFAKESDRRIAGWCAVSHPLVASVRASLSAADTRTEPTALKAAQASVRAARDPEPVADPGEHEPPSTSKLRAVANQAGPPLAAYQEAIDQLGRLRERMAATATTLVGILKEADWGKNVTYKVLDAEFRRMADALAGAQASARSIRQVVIMAAPAAICDVCSGDGCAKCNDTGFLTGYQVRK